MPNVTSGFTLRESPDQKGVAGCSLSSNGLCGPLFQSAAARLHKTFTFTSKSSFKMCFTAHPSDQDSGDILRYNLCQTQGLSTQGTSQFAACIFSGCIRWPHTSLQLPLCCNLALPFRRLLRTRLSDAGADFENTPDLSYAAQHIPLCNTGRQRFNLFRVEAGQPAAEFTFK